MTATYTIYVFYDTDVLDHLQSIEAARSDLVHHQSTLGVEIYRFPLIPVDLYDLW